MYIYIEKNNETLASRSMHHFELSSYFLDRIASINDSQKSIFERFN